MTPGVWALAVAVVGLLLRDFLRTPKDLRAEEVKRREEFEIRVMSEIAKVARDHDALESWTRVEVAKLKDGGASKTELRESLVEVKESIREHRRETREFMAEIRQMVHSLIPPIHPAN